MFRARLLSTGQEVAVKVQRPGALATISKVRLLREDRGAFEFRV